MVLKLSGQSWPLEDWVSSLEEGLSNLEGLERFLTSPPPAAGTSMDLVAADTHDFTLQAVLFKALHGFRKQARGSNMLYNLQAAAFHLSFMLRGHTANEKLVSLFSLSEVLYLDSRQAIPNVPDSWDDLDNACVLNRQHSKPKPDIFTGQCDDRPY